jgi:hypothetical protein
MAGTTSGILPHSTNVRGAEGTARGRIKSIHPERRRIMGANKAMMSAWRYHRKSAITLEEAVIFKHFQHRKLCQKCGEKFLRRKAEEQGGKGEPVESRPEMAETPREAAVEETAATDFHVGDSQSDYPVG